MNPHLPAEIPQGPAEISQGSVGNRCHQIELREFIWTDIAEIVPIEAELFDQDSWSAETFWSELAGVPERRRYLVAVAAGRVVGYAGLAWNGTVEADLQTLAVAAPGQGQGVGRMLLERLFGDAANRGVGCCLLEVRAGNVAAIKLYESVGFETLARRRRYYADGSDALIMKARLEKDRFDDRC